MENACNNIVREVKCTVPYKIFIKSGRLIENLSHDICYYCVPYIVTDLCFTVVMLRRFICGGTIDT